MKKLLFVISLLVLTLVGSAASLSAQGTAKGPEPTLVRDKLLEQEALHNLEVARQYFKLKKAYRASLSRCEETIVAYPDFTRYDEVLYLAGMSSYYLSVSQGKQKPTKEQTPDKMKASAIEYLSQLVNDFPDSVFKDEALRTLQPLGGPVKKS
ncbi:MAG: outer membrane protein assembly factor BamD [Pyrinomonadaceae bacterium]